MVQENRLNEPSSDPGRGSLLFMLIFKSRNIIQEENKACFVVLKTKF